MKTIEEMQSVMFDINADLDACVYGYNHLFEEVFGVNNPAPEYTSNFKELQSMFWLLNHTLYKFAGKLNLLMGEGDNPGIKYEFDQIKPLYAIDTPAAEQK